MLPPDYYHVSHKLKTGAPSEDIWMEAQMHGCWISFDAYGDLSVSMDSRWPYSTLFAIRWSDYIASSSTDAYYE